MSEMKLSCEAVRQVEEVCEKFNNDPGELIAILHECQSKLGYLPEPVQRVIAAKLTMTPKGKYPISVCLGTACYVRGADKLLEEFKRVLGIDVGETTPDGKFSLDCLRCVGACGLAPVATIAEKVYGRLNPADIKRIVDEFAAKE